MIVLFPLIYSQADSQTLRSDGYSKLNNPILVTEGTRWHFSDRKSQVQVEDRQSISCCQASLLLPGDRNKEKITVIFCCQLIRTRGRDDKSLLSKTNGQTEAESPHCRRHLH